MPSLKNSRRLLSFIFAGILSFLVILLGSGNFLPLSQVLASEKKAPHWSYGGAENPTQWGQLSKDFSLCELGRDQSPINIEDAVPGNSALIEFNYQSTPLEIVNNGHTIQINYGEGSSATIAGENYNLLQFHFHTPSEHTLNQKASAMELHLVHQNASGQLAVVGVMIDKGAQNPVLEAIWSNLPSKEGTKRPTHKMTNAKDLLPPGRSYYSYPGSLTTPPCSEQVSWNVMAQPIQASEEQIATFASVYPVNARPVQPTNGRIIQLHN